jgi:hypothetical protein
MSVAPCSVIASLKIVDSLLKYFFEYFSFQLTLVLNLCNEIQLKVLTFVTSLNKQ